MLNLKLKTISELIAKDDIVVDTCCDHAYLAIYLKEHNLCKEVYASDISSNALAIAEKNIKARNLNIQTYLSDGLKSIPHSDINTVVIAGVGTSTALDIVKSSPIPIAKYIISSNSNHYELRQSMQKLGFFIKQEIVVKEHNKFYPIMLFTRNSQKYNKYELKYGQSDNQEYYAYLLAKECSIIKSIPKKRLVTRYIHKKNIKYLKRLT